MDGSRITDSPLGAVLLIIGSVIAVMALVCVIIQLYKNHISDRSMCREIYGTDKPAKHKSVPKKLKALEERFRELDIPPVYSFTGNCIFREVMDIVLNSYGEEGYSVYASKLTAEEKEIMGI